jgi:hypothetical protein
MKYLVWKQLVELNPATQTVRKKPLGMNCPDFLHQAIPQRNGSLVELLLETHDSADPATLEAVSDLLQ